MLHSFIYGFGKVKFCVDGAVNLLFNFTGICVEMVGDSLKVNQILRSRCSGSDGDIYSVMTNTQTEVTDGGYTAEGLRHVSEHHVGASWVRVDTVYSGFCLVLTWLHITRLTMNKSSVQVFIGNMLRSETGATSRKTNTLIRPESHFRKWPWRCNLSYLLHQPVRS